MRFLEVIAAGAYWSVCGVVGWMLGGLFAQDSTAVPYVGDIGTLLASGGTQAMLAWYLYHTTSNTLPQTLDKVAEAHQKFSDDLKAERESREKQSGQFVSALREVATTLQEAVERLDQAETDHEHRIRTLEERR